MKFQLTGQENTHRILPGPRFYQNEKNASPRIGSAHGKTLMEFITKIKLKVIFDQSMTLAVKNKERPKFIRFEVQTERREPDARTSTVDTCNIQHHTTLVLTFLLRLLMEAV